MAKYKKQLQLYSYLVESRSNQPIKKMHLYYTGDDSDNPVISFDYVPEDVESLISDIDKTIHKIINKEFDEKASDENACKECNFNHLCNR